MRREDPAFSIILPSLNEGAMLPMTIESVAQHSSRIPHEVLVVDDGSTDGSVEKLRHARDLRREPAPVAAAPRACDSASQLVAGR